MATPQILLIDGHAGVRTALTQRLRHMCIITAVENLEQAANVLRQFSPDAIILDPLTVATGLSEVISLLRRAEQPLIVLTSSLREGDAERLHRAGISAILFKGMPFADLLAEIEVAVGVPLAEPRIQHDQTLRVSAVLPTPLPQR